MSERRIQRQTDASVEAGTGVGPAITANTMTTDATVHNHTFSAANCFGRAGCNMNFQFAKGYKGDYNYAGGGGRAVRGVYVKIVYQHNPTACGACQSVQLLQVVRSITQTGGSMVTDDPGSATRRTRSGWGNASAPSRGWRVDTETTSTNPFYSSTWVGHAGSGTTPAILWDTPGSWATDTNKGLEFQTCAICTPSTGQSTVLGCVNWGYYIDGSGVVAFRPAAPTAACGTQQVVTDATQRWDAIPGNTAANIDFAHNPSPPAPAPAPPAPAPAPGH
jgi:hypothetical protein